MHIILNCKQYEIQRLVRFSDPVVCLFPESSKLGSCRGKSKEKKTLR